MKVMVIGVGGVGSWCAEALLRGGVTELTLVDGDTVERSNLNRQCEATAATLGRLKVKAMRERLLAIEPAAEVVALARRYPFADGAADLGGFDFVVDAIDSVADKAELILEATARGIPIVSSMGAALRTDPTAVRLERFDRIAGDALARALRQRFKRLGRYPAAKFFCAVSGEPAGDAAAGRWSRMTVTATFGLTLAAAVLAARK